MAMPSFGQNLNNESEFITCIRDFQSFMSQHIISEEQRVKEKMDEMYSDEGLRMLFGEKLKRFGDSLLPEEKRKMGIYGTSRENDVINVISFNYTSIADLMAPTIHPHGSTMRGDLILGVDSIEQLYALPYNLSRKGERQFIKPIFNQQYDAARIIGTRNRIASAQIICIYGASLGESDLTWRMEVINWLKDDPERHLIIYDYELFHYPKDLLITERMDIEDDRKEVLLSEWQQHEITDELVRNQIHFPVGYNMFDFSDDF